jgi:hypothetical protein
VGNVLGGSKILESDLGVDQGGEGMQGRGP